MKRQIIQFATVLNHGKSNESRPVVSAYACRNGLAAGHAVKQDKDGDFRYAPGWEIYHVATGALVSTGNIFGDPIKHPTPAAAMRNLKNKFKGTLLGKLRARKDGAPGSLEGLPEIIGKLKTWPKPAGKQPPGCERIAAKGYNTLRALVAEIDAAISTATRTSKKQRTFTIGRTRFTVGARLESLQRLRVQVIKNRSAFADSALPKPAAPVAQVAQAAPEVVAVIIAAAPAPRAPKAVAQAQRPRKTKPKAPQPAHDVWFYFAQQRTRAEHRAA